MLLYHEGYMTTIREQWNPNVTSIYKNICVPQMDIEQEFSLMELKF